MATLEQLKELFQHQEEKDDRRREKEKEDEDRRRKEDKDEMKEVIRSHMSLINKDIKDIKAKQDKIEGQVVESERKMGKKYDDIADKFGELEIKMKKIEERQNKKEGEDSSRVWPTIHPVGREESSNQPAFHPVGRYQPSIQPENKGTSGDNEKIYSVVRRARKTVGFSPITDQDIREVMDELQIDNQEVGMKEVMKDYFREEMAMPEDVIDQLEFSQIFRRAGGMRQEDDKLYVEFSEDNMPGLVYKFVRKMRKECNILTYIPDSFRERAAELEQAAFKMRHMAPSYNTKIRWGWGDLLLERMIRGSNEKYRTVNMTDLPPVDLSATPRERLAMPNPTTSPALGRKARKKRVRSQDSPNLSSSPKARRTQPDFQ